MNIDTSSPEYRTRLTALFYKHFQKTAISSTISNALETIRGVAQDHGTRMEASLRIASHGEKFYLDIGDADWSCIEIDSKGWRFQQNVPVLFRRTSGLLSLPIPVQNGSIGSLIECLNLECFEHFLLICGVLLVSFHPNAEYPILVLSGEQGTGKSTFARTIRSLVDPNKAPLRASPKNDDDFAIAGYNNHFVVFDNLSYIDERLSDNLCRMSTGAAISKRAHYTNRGEVLVYYRNPVIINGITDLARRPDLLSRCIIVDLQIIENRLSSRAFWQKFEMYAPTILGGLLNAVSFSLGNTIEINEGSLPRLAEFCRFVMSAEMELARQWNDYAVASNRPERWNVGDFLLSYADNLEQTTLIASEQIPYLQFLKENMRSTGFRGSATEILRLLQKSASKAGVHTGPGSGWPQSAQALGTMLQRHIPTLREYKIDVRRDRKAGGSRERLWDFSWIRQQTVPAEEVPCEIEEYLSHLKIRE